MKDALVVTGPGVEARCPGYSFGAALSKAITLASAQMKAQEPVTFYVRDAKDNILGYAAVEDGVVRVKGAK